MSTTGLARELKYDSLGGVDGASDGGEARAADLGAGTERGRHKARPGRGAPKGAGAVERPMVEQELEQMLAVPDG